jgi:hypothetical protein
MQKQPTRASQFSIPASPNTKTAPPEAGPIGPSSSAVSKSLPASGSTYPRTRVMLRSIVSFGT